MTAEAAASASTAPPQSAPQRFERGKTYYVRYVGKRKYMGEDPGDKTISFDPRFLAVHPGDVVEMSAAKAKQLFKDFRGEWQPSNEAAYEKSEDERRKREELEAERARKEQVASVERARRDRIHRARSSQSATDEDDEE